MRRLTIGSIATLLLMGQGIVGASAFLPVHSGKIHSSTKLVSQDSSPGSPKITPGTKAKERADANALAQAKKHHGGIAPRHKRHVQPSSTATPATTSTP